MAAKPAAPRRVAATQRAAPQPATKPVVVAANAPVRRKAAGDGAYFTDQHRSAAHQYYEAHPVLRPIVKWTIGAPVPSGAVVALVPRGLLAALPQVPPGHQYVELGGDVVLIATGSKMVVDGISRGRMETALLAR
jgi:hypothetical protein